MAERFLVLESFGWIFRPHVSVDVGLKSDCGGPGWAMEKDVPLKIPFSTLICVQ